MISLGSTPLAGSGTYAAASGSNWMPTQPTMQPPDPILFHELPVIRKIIQDETWLEGERRGCHVRPDDRVVREKVCEVILRVGHHLRETLSASVQHQPAIASEPGSVSSSQPSEAA